MRLPGAATEKAEVADGGLRVWRGPGKMRE